MALVVLPEGTQISGSIGGTTHSRNRFGHYIRNRTPPVNPNTDRQVAVRNAVRSLTIAWENTLTQAQRDAWNVYGNNVVWKNRLGQDVHLTGLNHYVRSNTELVTIGDPSVDVAPIIFNLATAELALGATASEATQQLTTSFDDGEAWATEVGAMQFFYMGLPQNAGIKFFGGPWRRYARAVGADPAVSPVVFDGGFAFGAGQRIWIRSRILRADGRLSEFAQVNFLGAA